MSKQLWPFILATTGTCLFIVGLFSIVQVNTGPAWLIVSAIAGLDVGILLTFIGVMGIFKIVR